MPFNKVLILSASAGAGHMRAADAVERAFRLTNAAAEVKHFDTLQYTNKLFRPLYSKAYIDLVNKSPELLGWFYDHLDKPWRNERRRLALDKLNTRPFVKMLQEYQPDITVCTHFLPAEIISWLKAKGRVAFRQAIVVTDFDVHAMWLCHHYEQYFVAMDETREHLVRLGIPEAKVTTSGIPIDPVFAETKDRVEMRAKHGLKPDVTTILVSAGGFGVGPIEHMLESMAGMRHPAQIVALCSRNAELKSKLEAAAKRLPPSHHVSFNPIPGQEERNSDHLLENGVAIRCNNLPVLAYKLDRLLDDPARFAAMQAGARRMARPDAARGIVGRLLELQQHG